MLVKRSVMQEDGEAPGSPGEAALLCTQIGLVAVPQNRGAGPMMDTSGVEPNSWISMESGPLKAWMNWPIVLFTRDFGVIVFEMAFTLVKAGGVLTLFVYRGKLRTTITPQP